jgi:hypothetical protein
MKTEEVKCKKCGCQIYDPFIGKIIIHNVEKCNGEFYKSDRPSAYNSNIKL